MDAQDFVDEESIRTCMGDTEFRVLEQKLQDMVAAQRWFYMERQSRLAAAAQRLEFAANHKASGIRPVFNIEFGAWAWLNDNMPGWEQDDSFVNKDLRRHHPELFVRLQKRNNFSGWSRPGKEIMDNGIMDNGRSAAPPPGQTLVITDRRGNVERRVAASRPVKNPHRKTVGVTREGNLVTAEVTP